MKTTRIAIKKTDKKSYISPSIERVTLDNEISLTLDSLNSARPNGDPTNWTKAPEHFNNDPFKMNLG
jgi:hypothetical protein